MKVNIKGRIRPAARKNSGFCGVSRQLFWKKTLAKSYGLFFYVLFL